ncbi:UDP-N-acetylmuramate:L-alanyl-gamma-D-glutamyl-meso-diaminopimelate ligase [Marinicella rhabdoformis]|uniref:UDP-N-acetylmuramate:L-alanyl-gamma-D-glutamyl- meso-diaminopimelate ligase n=1 Tax=Marinicella rhabdoformis TaxID=2580566 RepID=UPI0012AECDFE|nr:UDP-N-acetylmuramate:L-alanyl-gamma-D-glutamyl-meso-diaminopimelate ligase [Marinicella rhabdoformis]
MPKTHILGICGTFMGGIAAIARQLDHQVSGADKNVYPPMSTQLKKLGIAIHSGYDAEQLSLAPDQVVVGNVMTRGMPVIESLLKSQFSYVSGPQWLGEHVLRHKKVYAVAGTHGKTTTSSMLAWILEDHGINPGFLIGGVCHHFEHSARLTDSDAFVIEADEYDAAFFDKRSKFVHYHGDVVILNNLEFDHADIFENLDAIKKQFHHLVRTVPNNGCLVVNNDDDNLKAVLELGHWTPIVTFGSDNSADYWVQSDDKQATTFHVMQDEQKLATIDWQIPGQHNQLNALAAVLAAREAGIGIKQAADSLTRFQSVKRRMELIGVAQGVTIYDDFAHHPTAIATTIAGAKSAHPGSRVIVVLEPRSNSMRAGAHAQALPASLSQADLCYVVNDEQNNWSTDAICNLNKLGVLFFPDTVRLIEELKCTVMDTDVVVFMSNGGFDGVFTKFYNLMSNESE